MSALVNHHLHSSTQRSPAESRLPSHSVCQVTPITGAGPLGDSDSTRSFRQHSFAARYPPALLMFTPPLSQPPQTRPAPSRANLVPDELLVPQEPAPAALPWSQKYKVARRLRWSAVLVPLALVLLVATTRFLSHPVAFDLLIPGAHKEPHTWTEMILDWSPHMAHTSPSHPHDVLVRRSATPTVAPPLPQNPALPTPFPQPFDTTLSTNFSTTQCYNFFLNMTQTTPFRSCRPFSLLLTHSHEFQEVMSLKSGNRMD